MANHVVALVNRNAMQGTALSAIYEQCGSFEMGDLIGNFERGGLLSLAYQGLNANNMLYSIVKKNGKPEPSEPLSSPSWTGPSRTESSA